MNLRDLEYVSALAEAKHFGHAAARCHVTQPTLSMQIAKLEQELGVALFERGSRSVSPTPEGRQVAAEARGILDAARRIHEIGRAAGDGIAGPFYLGAIPTIGPYLLPELLPELRRRYPDIELYLREEITDRLLERLRNGELDAAILSLPLEGGGIEYAPLFTEAFVAAMPEGHALARKKRLAVSDFADETVLLLEEGNCMRDQTINFCKQSAAERGDYRASSIECLRQMVGAGMGCTFLPRLAASGRFAEAAAVALRPLHKPAPAREVVLVWRNSHPNAAALRTLAGHLKKSLRRRPQ